MSYHKLTPTQKTVLKWVVEQVESGVLREDFTIPSNRVSRHTIASTFAEKGIPQALPQSRLATSSIEIIHPPYKINGGLVIM
jgi:hypothetical protein